MTDFYNFVESEEGLTEEKKDLLFIGTRCIIARFARVKGYSGAGAPK